MKYRNTLALIIVTFGFLIFVPSAIAKDTWIEVRSKNFHLLGNASEKEIRKVGTRLEQFRETFRQIFKNTNLSSPIPTTVFVFKSDSAYRPFKPKRADGKPDDGIAGYFMPGEDINYVTISTEGEDADTFGTIFHEYVHFIIETNFGKSDVPPWFNEGIAEYYQTFAIVEDQKVKLGLHQSGHLNLLQQNQLIPLAQLFSISNYQLHQNGNHSRSIFYAQSWALVHYLSQTGKSDAMNKFLNLTTNGTEQSKAFNDAFQMTYAQMEAELRKYVSQSQYKYHEISFKQKLVFDSQMVTTPLTEPVVNAYLGDLLSHTNQPDDAEKYLVDAIAGDPTSVMANTALGMVKIKQRKWDEAKKHLDVAISTGLKNHMAYYRYANLLSREGRDEFGYVKEFPKETAEKMRGLLRKAIEINPSFTESYEMLSFVNLVNNENLDESVAAMKKAMSFQPHNQRYALRLGELLFRQKKYADATVIAEKIAATASEPDMKQRADTLLGNISQMKGYEQQRADYEKRVAAGSRPNTSGGNITFREQPMTEAEIAKQNSDSSMRAINESLRKVRIGETRVTGNLMSISCKTSPVVYTIKTEKDTFTLTSKDFDNLALNVFSGQTDGLEVGCDAKLSAIKALITYRSVPTAKGTNRGEIVAIEFVNDDFRVMTEEELATERPKLIRIPQTMNSKSELPPAPKRIETPAETPRDFDAERRKAMFDQMRAAIRVPAAGETRVMGFLQKIECTSKGNFFHFKLPSGDLKVSSTSPSIRLMTQDLEGVQFGCTTKPIEFPVVIVYKVSTDKKPKSAGELLTLDFVPKSFTLEP